MHQRDAQQLNPIYTKFQHLPLHFNLHILPVTTADYAPLFKHCTVIQNSSAQSDSGVKIRTCAKN